MLGKINKRGLSQVIAIVLFILMSLSAIALIFGAVNNFLNKAESQLAPAFSCPQLQASSSKITSAQYTDGSLQVTILRSLSNEISSFDFVLSTGTESKTFSCGTLSDGVCPNCFIQEIGQEKKFYFDYLGANKVSLYANGNCIMDEKTVS